MLRTALALLALTMAVPAVAGPRAADDDRTRVERVERGDRGGRTVTARRAGGDRGHMDRAPRRTDRGHANRGRAPNHRGQVDRARRGPRAHARGHRPGLDRRAAVHPRRTANRVRQSRAVRPWRAGWRPERRRGYVWVDGRWRGNTWVPGCYRPRNAHRANHVWVDGHWAGSRWVDGHWRPRQRAGRVWVDGYYSPRGQWVDGFWRPRSRAGFVWVDGRWNGGVYVAGSWRAMRGRRGR